MKKIFLYIIISLYPAVGFPSTLHDESCEANLTGTNLTEDNGKTTSIWTMEECMAYSAEHSPAVAKARWDLSTAEANKKEAFADFFPSLSAQVGAQLNWGRNIDPETNTYNDVTTFGNSYGVYLGFSLFDGGRTFNSYKLARSEREKSLNNIQMQRDDRAIATMMAYVDALYYKGAIDIAIDKLRQSEDVLKLTRLQEELGLKSYPDLAQAEATVAGDEYTLVQQQNLYLQSMLKLRSTMNLPDEVEMKLDSAAVGHIEPLFSNDSEEIYSRAVTINPEALDAEMNVRAQRYRLLIEKGRLFPTISLNAGISTSYFKNLTSNYSGVGFGQQFRNNRGEYLSFTLSFPLFSNLNIISGIKRNKIALSRSLVEKEERLRQLHDNIVIAVADRNGYAQEILSLEAKTEADRKAYELNNRKYEEGLMSLIDVQLSANTYYSSRLSLLQKQMLYILKNKLVDYYKGNQSWMSR